MFFGGAPLWHASVVLWDVLRGVGIEDRTRADPYASAMHWRRETTARERDYVFKTAGGRAAARRHQIGG